MHYAPVLTRRMVIVLRPQHVLENGRLDPDFIDATSSFMASKVFICYARCIH